ncbi:hypothetical protein ACTA71_000595 [Dictyostelium dimigraforme]
MTNCPNNCSTKDIAFMNDHLEVCLNSFYDCPNKMYGCKSERMTKPILSNHIQNECTYLYCTLCGGNFNRNDYLSREFHNGTSCPNQCCVKIIKKEELEDHLLICLNGLYDCPNKINGCESRPMTKSNLFNHLNMFCTYLECNQCGENFNREDYFRHVYNHEFGSLNKDCLGCEQLIKDITPTYQYDNNHFNGCVSNIFRTDKDNKNNNKKSNVYLVGSNEELNIGSITKGIRNVHILYGFRQKLKNGDLSEDIKSLYLHDEKVDYYITNIPRSVFQILLKLKPGVSTGNDGTLFRFDTKQQHFIDSIPNIKKLFSKDGYQIITSKIMLENDSWIIFTKTKIKTNHLIPKPNILNNHS